jgi:hypothetical protein
MPILTICIPSYNYGHYLGEAVASCLSENCDIRVIVVDNASTDHTPSLREQFAKDARLVWVRNEKLLPVQENWNKAVSLARTPWVKLLQADDRLLPGALPRLCQCIQEFPEVWFHAHLSEIIDIKGNVTRRQWPYTKDLSPLKLSAGEGLPLKLRLIARLKEPTSNLYRKEAWEKISGYTTDMRFTFDVAFNVELMARYSGVLWSEYLAQVRRHGGSDGAKLPAQMALDDHRQVVKRILRDAQTPSDRRAANAWLQYRTFELTMQRLRKTPLQSLAFLIRQMGLLSRVSSWPGALAIAGRRVLRGDVQKCLHR